MQWVAQVTGDDSPKVVGTLPGSTTATLYVVKCNGSSLVLRRYDRSVIDADPGIAEREVAGLVAGRHALDDLVPEVIAADTDGTVAGAPTVLMSFATGAPAVRGLELEPLAVPMAKLHRRQAPATLVAHTPPFPKSENDTDQSTGPEWTSPEWTSPEWSSNEDAWNRALAYLEREAPEAPAVFLHGDYHPGNVLWHQGELSAVVDWAEACAGPAMRDVAHCRTNLAFLGSISNAEEFLAIYAARSPGYVHDKWWDLAEVVSMSQNLDGVLALNAFGAGIDNDVAHRRADAWLLHVLD